MSCAARSPMQRLSVTVAFGLHRKKHGALPLQKC